MSDPFRTVMEVLAKTPDILVGRIQQFDLSIPGNSVFLPCQGYESGTIQAVQPSGWTTAVITAKVSNDPAHNTTAAHPTATTLSAVGVTAALPTDYTYFGAEVTTTQASAKCDLYITLKKTSRLKGDPGAAGATGATGAAGTSPVVKVMSADQSINNSTTLANLTDLVWPIGANETWAFELTIHAGDALGTTGYKIGASMPVGATGVLSIIAIGDDGGETWASVTTTPATGLSHTNGAVDADPIMKVSLLVVNGANAGNVQFQFAQKNSDVTNMTFKQYSFGVASKV